MLPDVAVESLRKSGVCAGLPDADIQKIASVGQFIAIKSGESVYLQGSEADGMYIIVRGRVKLTSPHPDHDEIMSYLGPGSHFGDLALLTGAPRLLTATTTMHTDVIRIPKREFRTLIMTVPGFAANISLALGQSLRGTLSGVKRNKRSAVVGIVAASPTCHALVGVVATGLAKARRRVAVISDLANPWPVDREYPVLSVPSTKDAGELVDTLRERVHNALSDRDHVLIGLSRQRLATDLLSMLMLCEEIWWLVEIDDMPRSLRDLDLLLQKRPALADRIHWIWVRRSPTGIVPIRPRRLAIAKPDFQVTVQGTDMAALSAAPAGLSRLVHHVIGRKIGLALGGGGAKGMAHLGVLNVLEDAGIHFDAVSGVSIGSLVGLFQASGLGARRMLQLVSEELIPNPFWRWMPGGKQWYFVWMFRTGGWEWKLRKFFPETDLTQLPIPFFPVSVDLIRGETVVRETGDAVHAVLESLNIPGVARPILRDGQALVDGGVLNNVPATALRERGCDLVIGVDIMSKLSPRFGRNRKATDTEKMNYPGLAETMFRLFEVQQHGLVRAEVFDVLISPDTSGFSFFDFSKASRLAEIGAEAATQVLPELMQAVHDLYQR
jgi:predicted acylesterase/phospholipase RssA/CRP-like cAMP-binding protein